MQTRLKVCWNGCSMTVGEGFPEQQRKDFVYDSLVSKHFDFESANNAKCGFSNHKIFLRSCQAILSQSFDMVFTQWTALNRLWLSPGPDCNFFLNDVKNPDFKYRDIVLSETEKNKLRNNLLLLNHDYQNILDLIDYCDILCKLSAHSGCKIVFINGLVPWTKDLDNPLTNDLNSCLSDYTKKMLDFNSRDDTEIVNFFSVLQNKFSGLDKSKWVNLFDSFFDKSTDVGPLGHHPGVTSNQWMAQQTIKYLEQFKLV